MIDVTAQAIKNKLKADLNGWLEFVDKYPKAIQRDSNRNDQKENPICGVFEQTIMYYGDLVELAKEVLHDILFYTLTNKEDFDLPRFENSISYEDYMDLIEYYKLHTFMKRELWKMEPSSALALLGNLYDGNRYQLTMFDKTYMQLAVEEGDEMQFSAWLKVVMNKMSLRVEISQLYDLIIAVYECLNNYIRASRRIERVQSMNIQCRLFQSLERVLIIYDLNREQATIHEKNRIFNALFAIVEMARQTGYKDVELIEKYCSYSHKERASTNVINLEHYEHGKTLSQYRQAAAQLTLKEFMTNQPRNNDMTDHEHVFATIVSYICRGFLPNQQDDTDILSAEEDDGMERLENVIKEKQHGKHLGIMSVFYNCAYIIRRRSMFWKSILKVIIQFLDLWIELIEEAKCADIFATFISHENMMPVLYKHILKHVQHYKIGDNSTTMEIIKKLTQLLELCLDHTETNKELLLFRDYVFNDRDANKDIHMPIFGSLVFWNIPFQYEMIRINNQITSFEQDIQIPDDIIRRLIKLSLVWPYEVVRQLVFSSIRNKNQYKAIIPVLHNLGNLCILKGQSEESQDYDQLPLLLLILKEIVLLQNIEMIEKYRENIIQFIKASCTPLFQSTELPLILIPNSIVDQSPLLRLQDILNECILLNSSTSCHIVPLEFSLHALNSFCESSLNDWPTSSLDMSDLPVFLYCSPETYLVFLSNILLLRSSTLYNEQPSRLPLQDYEYALKLICKLSDIVQFALKSIGRFPRIYEFFTETLPQYDWKTQLVWYHVTRGMTKHSLKVPSSLFRITGGLDDLFVEYKNPLRISTDANEGWYELLTACKLSVRLTDELFKHADQWMYNLLLLWKHPYENNLLHDCLQHVLHPKTSLSVSVEYPNLLIHFLTRLYESFPDVHNIIQEYNGYEDTAQMLPIVRNLTEPGTRQYFIVLFVILLIKNQVNSSNGSTEEEDKQDNYFISHLINLLQGLTNWGNISRAQAISSYNELKAAGAKLIPSIKEALDEQQTSTFLGAQSELDISTEFKTLQYPLLSTAELISDRALSILTLYHTCSILTREIRTQQQQESIDRVILLIMEGLIDMPGQQIFQRILQQQPKSRFKLWKQRKSNTKFMMEKRPTLTIEEEKLLRPIIDNMPASSANRILQALGLTGSHKETQKKQYLYFLN